MKDYRAAEALREYMLIGNRVSLLEAFLLFGVQAPNAEFGRLKKRGFLIRSQLVPMPKIIRRINQFAVCKPPKNLPTKEILMREYWIAK